MSAAEATVAEQPKGVSLRDLAVTLAFNPDESQPGTRELNPTQERFLFAPVRDRGVKGYMGVVGCAKTTTGCIAGILHSLMYPGNVGYVARKVKLDLKDTTFDEFVEICERVPGLILKKLEGDEPELILASAPKQGPGGSLMQGPPSKVIFRPLVSESKLGSLKLGWFLVDEASEVEEPIIHRLVERLRHPKIRHRSGFLVTNPMARSHWWYRLFEETKPEGWFLFRAGAKENAHNLPANYYESLASHYPPDMRIRLIEGEYGSTLAGKPVYTDFRETLHVAPLRYNEYLPMFRSWDFGFRRPACVWFQLDSKGDLNVLDEELGHDEELGAFARRVLMRSQLMFSGVPEWQDFCDPAGAQQSDKGMTSVQMLIEAGVRPRYRVSKIEDGLAVVRKMLSQLQHGRPAMQVDPRCKVLIEGMAGGYHYPPEREGKASAEVPWKDGYYDHLQDALRYGVINIGAQVGLDFERRAKRNALAEPRRPRNMVTGY